MERIQRPLVTTNICYSEIKPQMNYQGVFNADEEEQFLETCEIGVGSYLAFDAKADMATAMSCQPSEQKQFANKYCSPNP
jgi:hypothetical protein